MFNVMHGVMYNITCTIKITCGITCIVRGGTPDLDVVGRRVCVLVVREGVDVQVTSGPSASNRGVRVGGMHVCDG